jgi:DNA polymerase III sliding clamp (beta) subunit (PCNA family)
MKNSYLLPLSTVKKLIKVNPVKVCQDDAYVHFECDNGSLFSCRKASGKYPSVSNLFEVGDGLPFILPKELKEAAKAVEFLADNEDVYDRFVTVEAHNGKMRCGAENDRGWTDVILDIEVAGVLKFKINPVFLYEILGMTTAMTLGREKALFETDNFKHVMVLPE